MTTLFVYGTLKRGGSNHAHLAGQKFLGPARTAAGYTLVSLGDYPGLVRSADDRKGVTGELWSVDDPCLAHLDEFEGITENLYRRAEIPLATPRSLGSAAPAETYFYARPVAGRPQLGPTWSV